MASNIVELNNNIIINASYSIEFFDFRDYTLNVNDFSMSDWSNFINTTETFSLPLKGISTYIKNQKIWYRNSSPLFDKIIVDLDPSKENNLLEFIARKAKYNNIVLDDLKMLGAIVKLKYISNTAEYKTKNLFVGRISVTNNTGDVLKLTIDQLNKILSNSDFEKYVKQSPTASCYNFISIKQSFENIYNAPHNIIDDKSYPVTPFKLDESNYLPVGQEDITLKDDNFLTNPQIYGEDFVANTTKDIHCQFYYNENDPSCGYKMTEYNDDKIVISEANYNVMNWTVWSNTTSALANWPLSDGYEKDVILNYQRYFRPFKIAFASVNEATALNGGNYRTKKDYIYPNYGNDIFNTIDNSLYEPIVNNYIFGQRKILPGENEVCEEGDTLVYFEQLGDVRYRIEGTNIPSANILYDNYSIIWVYNQTRDIVYFDHITTFVQSTPLPSMWLDMKNYITTEEIYFASRLNFDSSNNDKEAFASFRKPMCAVNYPNETYGSRQFVASRESYKTSQNSDGTGGVFVGEKSNLPYVFGDYDLSLTAGYDSAKKFMDYIQTYNKPKSVRISNDGSAIYFLKNITSQFTNWDGVFTPVKVKASDYTTLDEFPTLLKWCAKAFFTIKNSDSTLMLSQKEYSTNGYLNWDFAINEKTPLFTEISSEYSDKALVLMDSAGLNANDDVVGDSRIVQITTTYTTESTNKIITNDKTKPVANFFYYNGDYYWVNGSAVYKQMDIYFLYGSTVNILDFYIDATKERAIIQAPTELQYYDTINLANEYSKDIIGFEYILSCGRENMVFINPIKDKTNEIIRITQVTNESVRLLSFSGNRYIAGDRLASSFFKNSYYDGDGILNIGYIGDKIFIDDNDIETISINRYKYDTLEYTTKAIEKNGFTQQDNSSAGNQEEDDQEYDKTISIEMTSTKDINLNFTISRTGASELTWEAINEFGVETATISETGFNLIEIDLTGDFLGIHIVCNFFNTELLQGEKFRGVIERREYADSIQPETILTETNQFPFLDDSNLSLDLPFIYEEDNISFSTIVNGYFVDDSEIREVVELVINIPCLLYFNKDYETFNPNTIVTLSSDTKYNKGYELINITEVEPYTSNKCDYYIEKMKFNKKEGTTTLNLVSV